MAYATAKSGKQQTGDDVVHLVRQNRKSNFIVKGLTPNVVKTFRALYEHQIPCKNDVALLVVRTLRIHSRF